MRSSQPAQTFGRSSEASFSRNARKSSRFQTRSIPSLRTLPIVGRHGPFTRSHGKASQDVLR